MNDQTFIECLAKGAADPLPPHADVIVLEPLTLDDLRARAHHLLRRVQQLDDCARDRGDWVVRDDHTLVHLPGGGRLTIFHASGAMQYVSGLTPAQASFERVPERDELTRLVDAAAHRLMIADWAGAAGELIFEQLFQTKGRGIDRQNVMSEITLFRALGAYRLFVNRIPVLGPASVAVRLAGDGQLDLLTVQARPRTAEVVALAAIVEPAVAAQQILMHLLSLLHRERLPENDIETATMQFGYLDLGKRTGQRVLAPVFVAQIVVRNNFGRQAYVLATRATERPYLDLPLYGDEAVRTRSRTSRKGEHDDVIR